MAKPKLSITFQSQIATHIIFSFLFIYFNYF